MRYLVIFLITLFIFIIVFKNFNSISGNITYVEIDTIKYKVWNDEKQIDKANILHECNTRVIKLLDYFKSNNYFNNDDIKKLCKNYNSENLCETFEKGYTAYTENKGTQVSLCLTNTDGNLVDINTALFVLIHELSHIMTKETGHPPIFWENMKKLLIYAIDNNIYIYRDYTVDPVYYCGEFINHSPYIIEK